MANPFLSIIIPAYNEENRLPATLVQVKDFVQRQQFSTEVLVVENGSQDRTFEAAREFADQTAGFEAIHEEQRGKGLAVRRGMLAAQGEYRFMCDADLSRPIDETLRFLPPALNRFDVAIGSREAPGSRRFNEPFHRHWGGRVINLMIRALALPGLHDTQCGFKCFRAEAAQDLFQHLTLTGWSFDIEVLFIARQRGYVIQEVPISWYFNPESKLSLIQDTFKMWQDVLTIRRNHRLGQYARRG